jgi:hypothetical protein
MMTNQSQADVLALRTSAPIQEMKWRRPPIMRATTPINPTYAESSLG